MDPQMIQSLFSPGDQTLHSRAIEYLQQLRESPGAWKVCVEQLSTRGLSLDDKIKFVCLQVLEYYAKTGYLSASNEDQIFLRQHVSQWLTTLCVHTDPEKVFIRNKTAQLVSLIFVIDYVVRWPTLMSDLLSLLQLGANAIDIYLKILLAIDYEVVDREYLHSQVECERNNLIKDAMRERCVVDMANSWYDILVKYEKSHPEIVCHCHDVIGAYIAWIDISLIANDRFVSILVIHLQNNLLRESAADCIHEIITKGMDPLTKFNLIESLFDVLEQAGVVKPTDDDDSDFLLKMAKLINGIGVQLIQCWQKLKKNAVNQSTVRQAVENKITLLMSFMASEYDDVSAAVFDFARDYIQLIKQTGTISVVEKGQLENMLFVMINKTKYDESYNFDQDGEDEAIFDDYRKKLKVVCKDYVLTTLNRWQSSSYYDVEAAISLTYSLAEALPASHGNNFAMGALNAAFPNSQQQASSSQSKTTVIQEMMHLLMSSRVSNHTHPAVVLQFFECITRYEKFFSYEPQYIPEVLAAFLDQRGMRNSSPKVRSRAAYLFSRIIRCQKGQISNYTDMILSQLTDLLEIEMPSTTHVPLLSMDDQLYVYEASASLIVSSSCDHQRKEMLMRNLLSPLFVKVTSLGKQLSVEEDIRNQISLASCIVHATSVTARTSKAFSNQVTMQALGCVPLYLEATQLFLTCLNIGIERETICSGVRQLMHRLVVCLEVNELMQILPLASQALLQMPSTTALTEYIPLINQIITKFKLDVLPFLQEIFVPLVSAIFEALAQPLEENEEDERRSNKILQRNYYMFLNTVVTCGLLEVLIRQEPQVLRQVLMSVIHGAVEFPDPGSQKCCFVILKHLIDAWTGIDAAPPHFLEFLYTEIIPACFIAPLKTTFDLNDAQSILALQESSACLQLAYGKRGEELLNFLRTDYLPKIKMTPEVINEYCRALASDVKLFRNYSKIFFQKAKS